MSLIVGGTWTYSGDPSVDSKDAVRYLVGDTNGADQLVSDEEILYSISRRGSVDAAAAEVALAIAAGFATKVSKAVGDLRLEAQQKYDHYVALSKTLGRIVALGAIPYAGGISVGDKSTVEVNTDRVAPGFAVGAMDNPQITATST